MAVQAMADNPENLVLLQLQGLRREMAAMLERQVRDRELSSKVYNEISKLSTEIMALRADVREMRSDLILVENQMQNRHNEVPGVIRRLDALGAPSD
jgi:SMC interacting uncharacterized protein involved in chromosome segregation